MPALALPRLRAPPMSRLLLAGAYLTALTALMLLPHLANAQRPAPAEDGRLRGAPRREVTYAELPSGSGQMLALNPRYHMLLEFPSNVQLVSVRNPKMLTAEVVDGNKVFLLPLRFSGETSMQIFMDDPQGTSIPYIVRLDTLANPVLTVHYTDPAVNHLRDVEDAVVARERARFSDRVATEAEARMRQRLLNGVQTYGILDAEQGEQRNKYDESIVAELVDVTLLDQQTSAPRTYIRYRIANLTRKPITGLTAEVTVDFSPKNGPRPAGLQQKLGDVEDSRDRLTIPAGTYVEGLLIFDDPGVHPKDRITVRFEHPDGVRLLTRGVLGNR